MIDFSAEEYLGSVAIVGMACRFPRADTVGQFWAHLASGTECITDLSATDLAGVDPQLRNDPNHVRRSAGLDAIEAFDATLFDFTALEARLTNPCQRLLLMCCHEALADAGYYRESRDSRVGVFVGGNFNSYAERGRKYLAAGGGDREFSEQMQLLLGSDLHYLATRISYKLGLTGPSLNVNSACSTSLVAVCTAVKALQAYECDMALAGGCRIELPQNVGYLHTRGAIFSRSGHCRSFDADADGTVFGNGVGVVLLKRLDEALAAHDNIQAIIRGTAVNNDGQDKVGFTAPSVRGQARVIAEAIANARVDARSITHVETHGTATSLGDPIEAQALREAFRQHSASSPWCALGSVKSNLGHLEAAAGIASLIKTVQALKHRQLPASINFTKANPALELEGSPFFVNTRLCDWQRGTTPRRAGVSSFGIGGTNAHVVLEEAPERSPYAPASAQAHAIIVLSALDAPALRAMCGDLLHELEMRAPEVAGSGLWELAYTLQVGRNERRWRLACIVRSCAELCAKLRSHLYTSDGQADLFIGTGTAAVPPVQIDAAAALDIERLRAIAAAWVGGAQVDWISLYGANPPARISLPGYPFDDQHHWLEVDGSERAQRVPIAIEAWLLLEEHWTPTTTEKPDWKSLLEKYRDQQVCLLYDQPEDRSQLEALLAKVQDAIGTTGGEAVHLHSVCIDRLAEQGLPHPPDVILYLESSDSQRSGAAPEALQYGPRLARLVTVMRYLLRNFWSQPLRAFYIYNSTASAEDAERDAVSGLLRSVRLENPRHCWSAIRAADAAALPSRYQLLLREWLTCPAVPEAEVCHREGVRRIRSLREQVLRPAAAALFRQRGTYLLAGANGPVGEQLIRALARKYQARLAVVARHWDASCFERLRRSVERSGGTLDFFAADVCDREQLRIAQQAIKHRLGAINGVVQLARAVRDGLLINKELDAFSAVIAAKVSGTRYLDELTSEEPLDCFVVFSSMSAYGLAGGADYAYAAAFQNSYCNYRNRLVQQGERAGRTLSLCWGAWEVDRYWSAARTRKVLDSGLQLIDAESAIDLLDALSAHRDPIVGAMPVESRERARRSLGLSTGDSSSAEIELLRQLEHAADPDSMKRILSEAAEQLDLAALSQAAVERIYELLRPPQDEPPPTPQPRASELSVPDIEEHISSVLAGVLKLARVDTATAFSDLGIDSLKAIQVSTALERGLRVRVEARWLLDHPCIAQLARFVFQQSTTSGGVSHVGR